MGCIKNEIKNLIIYEDSANECNVSFSDINIAFKNSIRENVMVIMFFYSDHIMLSTNKFKTIIIIHINCMLIHGHNVEVLLASVIAPIPKNLQSNFNTSDNYLGISLYC